MEYYRGLFGGEVTNIQKSEHGKCLHAELHLGLFTFQIHLEKHIKEIIYELF
jgi:hypothetical protein